MRLKACTNSEEIVCNFKNFCNQIRFCILKFEKNEKSSEYL